MEFKEFLNEEHACEESQDWFENNNFTTIEEAVINCHRGDWLLWLGNRLNLDKRLMVKTSGRCAATVKHLMKDQLSLDALQGCEDYGNGLIDDEQLGLLSVATNTAYAASIVSAAYAANDANADRKENQLETANICRELIGQEIINKYKEVYNG